MKDNAGNNYIFAGDNTRLYNISGVTVTDYSQAGNYTDNQESWSFIKWNNQVIASKMGDTPQVLTLGSSTFADLGGSPPQSRTMTTVNQFVVVGNTWDSTDGNVTNRIRWSGFDNEAQWTVGTNQSDFQDLQSRGGAVQRIVGGEYGVVFQERSISRIDYVGTPLVFQQSEIEPGKGTPSPGSVIQHGANIYYLAQDGFYVLRNGTTSEPIGVNKVNKWFWSNVNESYLSRISGAFSPDLGAIVWSFPSASSMGQPDRLLIYEFKIDKWSYAEVDTQVLIQGATSAYTLEQLDAFGNMETLPASLDDPVWKGGSFRLAAFDSSNRLSFFTGDTLSGTLETGEIGSETVKSSVRSVRPVIDGTSTLIVKTRNRLTDTPVNGNSISVDTSGKFNTRTNRRYHRFELTTSGDFTHAQGIDADVVSRGKR